MYMPMQEGAASIYLLDRINFMPTISMFYGIIVRMYFAPKEHPPPHFHVYYGEYKATIDIRTCEVIQGNLPKKQTKLVLAWAELHQDGVALGRMQLVDDGGVWRVSGINPRQ